MCGDVMDCLRELPAQSINTCITSPPYFGLRDYGCDGQIGLEESPDEYVTKLIEIFREVRYPVSISSRIPSPSTIISNTPSACRPNPLPSILIGVAVTPSPLAFGNNRTALPHLFSPSLFLIA